MQTAWINTRCQVTPRLIRLQAVWHSDNLFTIFSEIEALWKLNAVEKYSKLQFIWQAKGNWNKTLPLLLSNTVSCRKVLLKFLLVGQLFRNNGLLAHSLDIRLGLVFIRAWSRSKLLAQVHLKVYLYKQ